MKIILSIHFNVSILYQARCFSSCFYYTKNSANYEFKYSERGKPYFYDSELQFNVSDTKNVWICAFRKHNPVGIDIEPILPLNKSTLKIADRFFNIEEIKFVHSFPRIFSLIWTSKESYVKCTGEGITNNFSKFSVVNSNKIISSIENYFFYRFVFCNYIISVCTLYPEKETKIYFDLTLDF